MFAEPVPLAPTPRHRRRPQITTSSPYFLSNEISRRVPWSLRLIYPLIQLAVGAVVLSIVLNLQVWADTVGVTTTVLSWSLGFQGLGTLLSIPFIYFMSPVYHGHDTIPVAMLILALTTLALPYINTIALLCVLSVIIGFSVNMITTESFNLQRKLFIIDAGPWCGLSQLAYSLGGIASIIYAFQTSSQSDDDNASTTCINCSPWFYIFVSGILVFLAMSFFILPNPEKASDVAIARVSQPSASTSEQQEASEATPLIPSTAEQYEIPYQLPSVGERGDVLAPHYHAEFLIGGVLGITIGSLFLILGFITTYAEDLNLEPYSIAYYQVSLGICLFAVGIFAGIIDQATGLARGLIRENMILPLKMMATALVAAFALFLAPMVINSQTMFWVSTSITVFAYGMIGVYGLDWLNRITYATEYSTGIAITAMNLGCTALLAVTLGFWYTGFGVWAVIYITGAASLFMIPMIWHSRFVSYRPEINPWLTGGPPPPGPFGPPPFGPPPFGPPGPPPPPPGYPI